MSAYERPPRIFIGTFHCTLDEKGRFTLPAKFRRLFPDEEVKSLIVSKSKEKCLRLIDLERFDRIIEKLDAMEDGPEKRNLIRFYSTESEQVKVDGTGRIGIPSEYLATITVEKDVVVVGALTHMEVWKPEDYDTVRQNAIDTYRKSSRWEL